METFLCRKDTLRIMAVFVRSKPSLVPFLAALINCCTYDANERHQVSGADWCRNAQHLEMKGSWKEIFLFFPLQLHQDKERGEEVKKLSASRTLLSQLCAKEPTCGGQEGTANFPPAKLPSLSFSTLLYSWQEGRKTHRRVQHESCNCCWQVCPCM